MYVFFYGLEMYVSVQAPSLNCEASAIYWRAPATCPLLCCLLLLLFLPRRRLIATPVCLCPCPAPQIGVNRKRELGSPFSRSLVPVKWVLSLFTIIHHTTLLPLSRSRSGIGPAAWIYYTLFSLPIGAALSNLPWNSTIFLRSVSKRKKKKKKWRKLTKMVTLTWK